MRYYKKKKHVSCTERARSGGDSVKDTCVACGLYQLTYGEGVALRDMHLPYV